MWKLNKTSFINKAGIWKSQDAWNLNSQGSVVFVENTDKKIVLTRYVNDLSIYLSNINPEETNQMWKMVKISDDEYFKLIAINGYALTAKPPCDLKLDRGMP